MLLRVVVGAAILALLVWAGAAMMPGADDDGGALRIGVLLPLTGDAASYGESEHRAIQIAVDEINAAGGVNGRPIELVMEDGKCDPQAAGTAAQKLVQVDRVKVIIGGACSGETLAAAEVTEPARVILISPSASSPKVTEAGDYVFRTYPSDALAGRVAASYSHMELGARRAAVITELTDYAQGLREVFKSEFAAHGGEIVADETYNTGDTDFRTQVLKIRNANPDVVYVVPQTLTPGVALIRQLKDNRVNAKLVTAEVLLDREAVTANASVLAGVIGVEPAVDWEGNRKAEAFRDAHREKFDSDPGSFAANAYDAVYLVREAVLAAGGTDTEKIRDWLYSVRDWNGAVGRITMDSNGDPEIGLHVREIRSGQVADLGPYTP